MAYVEMIARDRARLDDCRSRLNESPLGAAALAGTAFPIDRHMTAALLGFDRPAANSLDAVSDRDFAIEFLSAAAIAGTHLSRFAEEIVIWSSDAYSFVALSDAFTTGSSIMPQKRNPDAAELVRAKTGRFNGALLALLTVMKGLPLTYQKDMQEDKVPVFEAADTLELCLAATAGMVRDMRPNRERLHAAAERGFSTATDLADWLVRTLGLPFREAHHVTGTIVKRAEARGCTLAELPLVEMQAVEPQITDAVYDVLDPARSAASRTSFGGTAPSRVREAVAAARARCFGMSMHSSLPGAPAGARLERLGLYLQPRARSAAAFRDVLMSGLFVVVVALMLTGCGKKNAPAPPPDQPNTFPRAYPSE